MLQLEKLSYSDMLFLREDPRVRAHIIQRFQLIRESFAWLTKLSDDDFLRYLANARIIGFSLTGMIEEIIDTLFPPVLMVASACALAFIDLCWNIGYYHTVQGKLCYVSGVQAQALTFIEDEICAFISRDNCYGVLRITTGTIIYGSRNIRQIMGSYAVSHINCLYHVIVDGGDIRFRLLSRSCAFVIETQAVGTYKRVCYRHIDGSSKVMFAYENEFLSMESRSLPGTNSSEVQLCAMRRAWSKHGFDLPYEEITMYQWGFYLLICDPFRGLHHASCHNPYRDHSCHKPFRGMYRVFTYRDKTYIAYDLEEHVHDFVTEETKNVPKHVAMIDCNMIDVTCYLGMSRGSKFYAIRL